MEILTLIRARLTDAGVTPTGGLFIQVVDQNSPRPNTLLELGDDSDEWSHQGPVGLRDAHVIVHARADNAQAATVLSNQIVAALNDWMGTYFGMQVQLLRHLTTKAAYRDTSKVFIATAEFHVVYRRTS